MSSSKTVEEADWDAVDRVLELVLGKEGPQGMEAEMAYRLRERFAAAFGGMPFISDPDHVASELARIAGWGFDGVIFGFVKYLEELPFFRPGSPSPPGTNGLAPAVQGQCR